MRIHKLPKTLANQIAAGEVIERPASVVKELLENSLDAGSSEINLDIQKGGRSLINIRDNGAGIHPDDLSLALCQHATSKLTAEANLLNIRTLGFRGEALSSIAAISRLTLASRMAGHDHGWTVVTTPGDMAEKQPIAMPTGTNVEIRDMFFNVPARRKFLRTDNTEFFHIRETVKRIALSRHDISFHLQHNGKGILKISSESGDIAERVQAIFGKSFLDNTFQLDREHRGLRLWGWFGHPEIARNQVDQQYFYLNGRMIRDKQVNHAVRMIADEHFYTGKHAVYVLFLEIDPAEVDVNVHPAKYEVRFRQARDVHDFILSTLRQLFVNAHTLVPPPESESPEAAMPPTARSLSDDTQPPGLRADDQVEGPPYGQNVSKASQIPPHNTGSNTSRASISQQSYLRRQHAGGGIRGGAARQMQQLFSEPSGFVSLEDHYLIVQDNDEGFLLDVFLCNELVVLADLQSDFSDSGIGRRPLLVPLSINVSTEQGDFFESERSAFEKYGVLLARISAESIVVREVPSLLEYADIAELVKDMVPVIKAAKPAQAVLTVMAKHVNDAGLGKMDNQTVARLLDKVKSIQSTRRAWCRLDKAMLANLLKNKT